MSVQHLPTMGNNRTLFNYWRPSGSRVVMLAANRVNQRAYRLLLWGDKLYLPVEEGDEPVLYFLNAFEGMWVAIAGFAEGANVYKNGPSSPEACTSHDLWEAAPGKYASIWGIHDPASQQTRPFVIESFGGRVTIAEAKYQDPSLRGVWAFHERWQTGYGTPPYRGWNDIWELNQYIPYGDFWGIDQPSSLGFDTQYREQPGGGFESLNKGGDLMMGSRDAVERAPSQSGRAGTGLGAARKQDSHSTGVTYHTFSARLALLHLEFRTDLAGMLRMSVDPSVWTWPKPRLQGAWFNSISMIANPGDAGIEPDVPISGPYRPR